MVRIPSDGITHFFVQGINETHCHLGIDYEDGVTLKIPMTNEQFDEDFNSRLNDVNKAQVCDMVQAYCHRCDVTPIINGINFDATPNSEQIRMMERYGVEYGPRGNIIGRAIGNITPGDFVAIDLGGDDDRIGVTTATTSDTGSMTFTGGTTITTSTTNPVNFWQGLRLANIEREHGTSFTREYLGSFGYPESKPKIKLPDMFCPACENELDQPENLPRQFSQKELDAYIKYCTENNETPQIYCCKCFDVAKKSPSFMNKYTGMIRTCSRLEEKEIALQKENMKVQALMDKVDKNIDWFDKRLDELIKSPLQLVLSELSARRKRKQRAKDKKNPPKQKPAIPDHFRAKMDSTTLDVMKRFYESKKFGQVIIHDPATCITEFGYRKIIFALNTHQGQTPAFKLEIPIPFMKKNRGIVYSVDPDAKKHWRIIR